MKTTIIKLLENLKAIIPFIIIAGLIFDESVAPDRTLDPDQVKPKVSLVQDPKQSQVCASFFPSASFPA